MSTQFTTDPIDTLPQWNAVLASGCCCEMPECPEPTKECESVTVSICGFMLPVHDSVTEEDRCQKYLSESVTFYSFREEFSDGYSYNETNDLSVEIHKELVDDECNIYWGAVYNDDAYSLTTLPDGRKWPERTDESREEIIATPGTGSGAQPSIETWTNTTTYESDPPDPGDTETTSGTDYNLLVSIDSRIPIADQTPDNSYTRTDLVFSFSESGVYTEIDDGKTGTWNRTKTVTYSNPISGAMALAGKSFPDDVTGEFCSSSLGCDDATMTRLRWNIPVTHLGTWFKLMWDVLEEPTGWDATIPNPEDPDGPQIPDPLAPARSWVSQDNAWEWTRPEGELEPADYLSGWYEIAPPSTPGTRRAANGRYWCYRGPFGNRPQLFLDQVDLEIQ